MGDFTRAVPKSLGELKDQFGKLAKNQNHVSGVSVNMTSGHLEVDLDWAANHMGGVPDFYMPIKRARLADAHTLVDKLVREIRQGFPPSDADVTQLYDMIDPTGR